MDYVFQPKKNSNGIGSWVEMGKVAKEEEEGIEEVFKYLLLYNTTSAHIVAESSKNFVRFSFYMALLPEVDNNVKFSLHMECLVLF